MLRKWPRGLQAFIFPSVFFVFFFFDSAYEQVGGAHAMARSAVHYSPMQRSAVQHNTVQLNEVQCSAAQSNAVQCSTVQRSAVQCSARLLHRPGKTYSSSLEIRQEMSVCSVHIRVRDCLLPLQICKKEKERKPDSGAISRGGFERHSALRGKCL